MGGMGAGPFLLHHAGQFIRRLGNGVKVEDVGRRGASQKRDGYECNEIHFLMFVWDACGLRTTSKATEKQINWGARGVGTFWIANYSKEQ